MIEEKELLLMSDGLKPVLEPTQERESIVESQKQEVSKTVTVEFIRFDTDNLKNIKLNCKLESYTSDFSNKLYSYNVSVLSKCKMEDLLFVDETYRVKVLNRITNIVSLGFSYSYDGSLFLNFATKE